MQLFYFSESHNKYIIFLFSLLAAAANHGYKVTVIDGSTTGFYDKGKTVTVTSITKPADTTSGWQGQTGEAAGNIRYQTRTTYTYKNGTSKTITNLQAPQTVTMGYNTKTEQINRQQYISETKTSVPTITYLDAFDHGWEQQDRYVSREYTLGENENLLAVYGTTRDDYNFDAVGASFSCEFGGYNGGGKYCNIALWRRPSSGKVTVSFHIPMNFPGKVTVYKTNATSLYQIKGSTKNPLRNLSVDIGSNALGMYLSIGKDGHGILSDYTAGSNTSIALSHLSDCEAWDDTDPYPVANIFLKPISGTTVNLNCSDEESGKIFCHTVLALKDGVTTTKGWVKL